MRFALLFLLLPCFTFAQDLQSINKSFAKTVKQELSNKSIPGAAYTIVKGDQVIAIETFGHLDKKKKQKVNKDTVFRLASVSKPFASTLTTMLAQEKKFSLADPITKYVPEFKLKTPGAAEKIQLRHILSHSSGLMPNSYDNLLHENWSMDKVIKRFDRISPICQPAKCYGYQNVAYGMLQDVIEQTQRQSYKDLLTKRIFEPLGMDNASVGIDVYEQSSNTAKPHVLRKRVKTGRKDKNGKDIRRYVWRTVDVTPDFYKVEPAAGVNASIADMAKWLSANLGYNPEVLPAKLLNELTTPRIETKRDLRRTYWRNHISEAYYGYGWRIYQFEGYELIYHSGWVAGFRADIAYSPDLDIGFAMLMNAEANSISKLSTEFWQSVTESMSVAKLAQQQAE